VQAGDERRKTELAVCVFICIAVVDVAWQKDFFDGAVRGVIRDIALWEYCGRSLSDDVGGPAELLDFVNQTAPPGNWRNSTAVPRNHVIWSLLRYAQQVGW